VTVYRKILVGLDGSKWSDHAGQAALALTKSLACALAACHVYAAQMHRVRFSEMEIGLPTRYQSQERLGQLRDTHDDIIGGGMKIISDAYLAQFVARATAENVKADSFTPEGRNYVEFVRVAKETQSDLLIVGAQGLGAVPESTLGSFAERALLLGGTDTLIMKREWNLRGRPIVVGVDGSQCSYDALRVAAEIANRSGTAVRAVGVYDPFFHTGVFNSISTALTNGQASRFNFAAQERLHDEIIDDGLKALYDKRVSKGIELLGPEGGTVKKEILTGKVFSQLSHYSSVANAALLVVGRHGVHQEESSIIGSTTLALARTCPTNLLVVGPPSTDHAGSQPVVQQVAPRAPLSSAPMPPQARAPDLASSASPFVDEGRVEARVVTLKKAKKLAPSFHEHIVRARIIGNEVEVGTRYMVFDVVGTEPGGRVKVTENTKLEFI